jgi:hypothetical protein
MDSRKLVLLCQTIKHLRFVQIYYRLFYFIRNKFFKRDYSKSYLDNVKPLHWQNVVSYKNSYYNDTFEFLNVSHKFEKQIDWNYVEYGKLWTYNLNYFDFLNQESLTKESGLFLINEYIQQDNFLKDGKEPYPISLRGINWVKFLSKHNISDGNINQILFNHYQILIHNLEYHLLGNHLLENGYALLFGAYYFKDQNFYDKAKQILKSELEEQILKDGAHFELSPMYHQILLHRLLDCMALIKQNRWKGEELLLFLNKKAELMLSWLQESTFKNGDIPKVNDCAHEIAPTSQKLFDYARQLNINRPSNIPIKDSGYRKFCNDNFELFLDVGDLKPTYQPGHAHSDTFSFELYTNQKPLIVDTGTSTYEKNALRQQERGTSAHNTVQIADFEQSDVWGGFRVGKRAKIISLEEDEKMVKATHNGYKKLGVLHERKFVVNPKSIIITDSLSKKIRLPQKAYFHFHPDISYLDIKSDIVIINNTKIKFKGSLVIERSEYQYAIGFNKTQKATKITVFFNQVLETEIYL